MTMCTKAGNITRIHVYIACQCGLAIQSTCTYTQAISSRPI